MVLAYLKYLNKYALTTNVSTYVKYVNSSDTQMYYILHMRKHLWAMHIHLNISNMLKDS